MSSRNPFVAALTAALVVAMIPAAVHAAEGDPPKPKTPRFVADKRDGIDHIYDGDLFYVGGGVAAFDCDDDQRPELYFAGGQNPAALYRNASKSGGALRFSRFEDPVTDLTSVTGAYPLDIDGDGITDLAVLRLGEDVLLRGLGDCRFERANEAWSFAGGDTWTTAFSATWEGDANLPTLATGGYLDMGDTMTAEDMCLDDHIYRPNDAGTGYGAPIPLSPSYCTLSMLFSDWNRSGRRDLRVSNDQHYYSTGQEQLWRIEDGQDPVLYTADDGWDDRQINGMGIATYDVTGDTYPEYYLTNQGENQLESLTDGPERPAFHNIGYPLGVSAQRPFTGGDPLASTAWHPQFEDVNNDGRIDLFVSKGNIGGVPGYAEKDPSNLLLGTADGTFAERAKQAGILSYKLGRGAAVIDLNRDGLLDVVQVERGSPVLVWRNAGSGTARKPKPMGHWVGIDLEQPGPNRDAIGALVDVQVADHIQQREVTVGGGHVSGQLAPIHVGLGDGESAQVRVRWPDGEQGDWMPLVIDQVQRVIRGTSNVEPLEPPEPLLPPQ